MRLALFSLLLACGADNGVQAGELHEPQRPRPIEAPDDPRGPAARAGPAALDVPPTQCSQDDDCVVGHDACGFEVAVRRDAAEAYEARMARLRPVVECASAARPPLPGFEERMVAFCSGGECRTASTARRCEGTSDCVAVPGPCARVEVVNREARDAVEASLRRLADSDPCGADTAASSIVAECRDGVCVGVDG